ncbi:MAG: isoamylase early set domain-containing protein [Verrucomicrobia bacterium]|nr:isoamylase early set domain-containing protein [Verrucomicrobiota bacterium]
MQTWETQYKVGLKDRYSARKMTKPVQFILQAPEAERVCIAGDFNHWNISSHPLARQPDGGWRIEVLLHHGHHLYAFIVDGALTLDPHAQGVAHNPQGQRVSVIAVS